MPSTPKVRQTPTLENHHGILAWFAGNPVAANILMIAIVGMGIFMSTRITQEVFPVFEIDSVSISIDYRGASPVEIEESIVRPLEDALRGLDMVRQLRGDAREGNGTVTIEITPGYDRYRALQEVTSRVQQISLLPSDAERPNISLGNSWQRDVMRIALYGELDEHTLDSLGREIEFGLRAHPGITHVQLWGSRRPEIHVEIPQSRLRSHGLTLASVGAEIRRLAVDVAAGTLRSPSGDIQMRTTERRYTASEYANLVILSGADGSRLRLGDIATVTDGFEDREREAYFNGRRAILIAVFSGENESPVDVAKATREFINQESPHLPDNVGISLSRDNSVEYTERLELLRRNGVIGLLLVLLALGFMLDLRVAFWTAAGIPVALIGSLILLPSLGATINMISLFGFIVALGIVVDDAVIVAEDVFHKMSSGMTRMQAAVEGAKQMSVPVIFAVSTNIIAFLPLMFVPGQTGNFFSVLPTVVIAVFIISLIECLFVLPAHLASAKRAPNQSNLSNTRRDRLEALQSRMRNRIDHIMEKAYRPLLQLSFHHRYITIAIFTALLGIISAWVASGRLPFTFNPTIEGDNIRAEFELPPGTPIERTREVAFLIAAAAERALNESQNTEITHGTFTEVARNSTNSGHISVTLAPQSQRDISASQFTDLWRNQINPIPDLESLSFNYIIGPGGDSAINVQIAHPDLQTLQYAATAIADAIDRYPGTSDIRRGFAREMPDLQFKISEEGLNNQLTSEELGRQIRHAFYGVEALRQPRDRQELRVMVRLPEQERRSIQGLNNLLIRTPDGGEMPFHKAASIIPGSAPERIRRIDGGRIINIRANVDTNVASIDRILAALARDDLPAILADYRGLSYSFEGRMREQREAMRQLGWGLFAALFAIYAIMAALLRNYSQALVILCTIPWSLAGAVIGHVLLGHHISVFSIFGMIALCGMVVNGAFVLAMTRLRYAAAGADPMQAIEQAALRRFRPILLTAATTLFGLGPMMFETSTQALFLVPMAISLGIGITSSAVVILILLPAILAVLQDISNWLSHSHEEENIKLNSPTPATTPPTP